MGRLRACGVAGVAVGVVAVVAATAVGCGGSASDSESQSKPLMERIDEAYSRVGGVVFRPQGAAYDPGEHTVIVLDHGRVVGVEEDTFSGPGGAEFIEVRTVAACRAEGRKSKTEPHFLLALDSPIFHAENMRVSAPTPTNGGWKITVSFRTKPENLGTLPSVGGKKAEPLTIPGITGRYTLAVERGTYRVTEIVLSADTEKMFGAKSRTRLRVQTLDSKPELVGPKPLCG